MQSGMLVVRRYFCSGSGLTRNVVISASNDIYTNLAYEDWCYKNTDLTRESLLMIWRNNPCVVIGKFQNPWLEANVPYLDENGIALARRNSGGGTVYHDMGNINLTFFTARSGYNRKHNLQFIVDQLHAHYGINTTISPREDLTLHDKKISGTAAKLSRLTAYHHCTLLVHAERQKLRKSLMAKGSTTADDVVIKTTATASIPSPVTNLGEIEPSVNVDNLIGIFAHAYKTPDGRVRTVLPEWNAASEEFSSWQWKFGKTPTFEVTFRLHHGGRDDNGDSVTLTVSNGLITESSTAAYAHLVGAQYHHNLCAQIRPVKASEQRAEEFVESLHRSV